MNELQILNNEITMNHVELCELINKLRIEEGNRKELRSCDLMTKIRKEVETLKSLGLSTERNFLFSEYKDKSGKTNPTYLMNRNGILQIASSESVYVRAKIIEYIQALENKITILEKDRIYRTTEYDKFIQHKDNRILDLSSAKYKKLEESIRLKGENKTPIIVNELPNGKYVVIEGNHRLNACRATNSVLRYVIDNEHTLQDAIEQETLTFNVWKNMSLYQYGINKQVPMCLYIQELYSVYQDSISLDNLIQITTRYLSRKEFNLKGRYPSHDGLFKKLKTFEGVEKLKQMKIYEEDKIRLVEFLNKFIEFYSYADYKPAVKDVEVFISMYTFIQVKYDIILKNWKKICKNKSNYPKARETYDKIKIARYNNFAEGILYLCDMTRIC